jgi:hypothetical protein
MSRTVLYTEIFGGAENQGKLSELIFVGFKLPTHKN